MGHLLAVVVTAGGLFAVTNVDDLVVLTALFVVARTGSGLRARQVVAGQVLGIGVLIGCALVAAQALSAVPADRVSLLGVFPLAFGSWRLWVIGRRGPESGAAWSTASGLTSVTGIAVINGVDNIAVYAPWFRSSAWPQALTTIIAFALMIGLWCALASWLADHLAALAFVQRFSHYAVPVVLIVLGAALLVDGAVG